jgi:hypothetical protein
LTDFFLRDVGITQFQFNVGQQLLSAGIVLLEVSPTASPSDASSPLAANFINRSRATFCFTNLGRRSGLGVRLLHGTGWLLFSAVKKLALTGFTRLNRGLVATFQAFQKGLGAYLSTRLLLGYRPSLSLLFNRAVQLTRISGFSNPASFPQLFIPSRVGISDARQRNALRGTTSATCLLAVAPALLPMECECALLALPRHEPVC